MQLSPGTRLGSYEILKLLGKGGMGEVYLALDPGLGREVAIKLLRSDRAGSDWIARFEREGRLLASLNHPNIAILHGRDDAEGVRFLIMEYVEGETLSQRLKRGPLPLDESLGIARQIAEALEAAHERGVIHRDLKPGNIILTSEGKVKVLDFGLATSSGAITWPEEPESGVTQTYHKLTAEGMIVGTPAYMSPEQARGKPLDRRCDIWAFGCILFEMLSRRPTFGGETYSDMLAAVMERQPDWEAVPKTTPPRIVALLRRCLQKDPQKRLRDIGDARLEIEETITEPANDPIKQLEHPRKATRGRLVYLLGGMLIGVLMLPLGMWLQKSRQTEPDTTSPPLTYRAGDLLVGGTTSVFGARVSPNGDQLAFLVLQDGQPQVGLMDLKTRERRVVTYQHFKGGVQNVCWSAKGDLYYDRMSNTIPQGICRISTFNPPSPNAPETFLVDRFQNPQVIAGDPESLLVTDLDSQGNFLLYRCRPESPEEPTRVLEHPIYIKPGSDELWWPSAVRTLHTRKAAVFCGKLLIDKGKPDPRRLYYLDLAKEGFSKPRVLYEPVPHDLVALAVSQDDQFVYLAQPAGESYQILQIPVEGKTPPRVIHLMTGPVYGLDVDQNNHLYVDQFRQPTEMVRFDAKGGNVERLVSFSTERAAIAIPQPIELLSGQFVLHSRLAQRDRLLLKSPLKDAVALLKNHPTRPPVSLVGRDHLAFVAEMDNQSRVLIGRIENNTIRDLTQMPTIPATGLTALTSTDDGKWIYYVREKTVWKVERDGGKPQAIMKGDAVAVHPDGKEILVQEFADKTVHLYRVKGDGRPEKIRYDAPEGFKVTHFTIGGRSMDRQGRVVLTSDENISYCWRPALLDLNTGKMARIPLNYEGDIYPTNWDLKYEKIIGIASPIQGEVWRFIPQK